MAADSRDSGRPKRRLTGLFDRPIEDVPAAAHAIQHSERAGKRSWSTPTRKSGSSSGCSRPKIARLVGRSARTRRGIRCARELAERADAAVSVGRHRLRRRRGPGGAGGRHGPGQDDSGDRCGRTAGAGGGRSASAHRLSRVAEVPVASAKSGGSATETASSSWARPRNASSSTTTAVSSRSATTNRCCATSGSDRARELGSDHSGRRPADQELGSPRRRGSSRGCGRAFALVLSGTPLENRLDELYSVVQFIDDRRLAPAFRFFHRHRVVDEKGKVIGYKNLDSCARI